MKGTAARTAASHTAATLSPKVRGFLHVQRHGVSTSAVYTVIFHRLDSSGLGPTPVLVEGAQALIETLDRIGLDFHRAEVRGALEDILRLGSANFPDVWMSDEELREKGLIGA